MYEFRDNPVGAGAFDSPEGLELDFASVKRDVVGAVPYKIVVFRADCSLFCAAKCETIFPLSVCFRRQLSHRESLVKSEVLIQASPLGRGGSRSETERGIMRSLRVGDGVGNLVFLRCELLNFGIIL